MAVHQDAGREAHFSEGWVNRNPITSFELVGIPPQLMADQFQECGVIHILRLRSPPDARKLRLTFFYHESGLYLQIILAIRWP